MVEELLNHSQEKEYGTGFRKVGPVFFVYSNTGVQELCLFYSNTGVQELCLFIRAHIIYHFSNTL